MKAWIVVFFCLFLYGALLSEGNPPSTASSQERHLTNLRQLTSGGENAEAYFSFDGTKLIFQSTRPPYGCDQIFTMSLDGTGLARISTGKGRATCGYFFRGDRRILFASTHEAAAECPPKADMSRGYVWALYEG